MAEAAEAIRILAAEYAQQLKISIETRVEEMLQDDISHKLLYRVLGIDDAEGEMIDLYQNKGRFLYKYAGTFLQEATKLCLRQKFPAATALKIPNTLGSRPRTFEIDCLVENDAFEIKWRDATTDGDHITKEHTRLKVINAAGYKPIRVMYYYPNRLQARKIQETLKTLYHGVDGEYYAGEDAWNFITTYTGVDLKQILEEIANTPEQKA